MKTYFDKPWWLQVDIEPAPAEAQGADGQAEVHIATFRIAWWAFPLLFLKGVQKERRPDPLDWPVIFLLMLVQWVSFARRRPILDQQIIVVHAQAA